VPITRAEYDELGTDIEPAYIENPLAVYVHDTMADYSKLHEATGWEPTIDFGEGVARVCEPYKHAETAEN
jgi:UDP-glucose 4-epimerase